MSMHLPLALLVSMMTAWAAPLAAETIYRCGNSYSQKPCAGGRQVEVDDARSASQGAQTRDAAQRDARLADEMEKARLKEEARAPQAYIPATAESAPIKAPAKATGKGKGKDKKPGHFTAVSPVKPAVATTKKKNPKKKPG